MLLIRSGLATQWYNQLKSQLLPTEWQCIENDQWITGSVREPLQSPYQQHRGEYIRSGMCNKFSAILQDISQARHLYFQCHCCFILISLRPKCYSMQEHYEIQFTMLSG